MSSKIPYTHYHGAVANPSRHHLFYGQRVVDLPDGKPKWEGIDRKSRQMDESEPQK
jgi:hypothetical protein